MTTGSPQAELYRFLESCQRRRRQFPSYREIAAALGWKSTSTVAYHIRKLIDRGLLEKEPGRVRSFRLKRYRRSRHLAGQSVEVPVRRPGAAGEGPPATVWLDRLWFDGEGAAVWVLGGDGPFPEGVRAGDALVVHTGASPRRGDLVLVRTGDGILAGRYYPGETRWRLLCREEPPEIILFDRRAGGAEIIGPVTGLLRRY